MAQASPTLARSPEPARLNLSGRALRITAPLLQGDINLGDVDMMVAPDDTISLPPQRLLDLMATVVEPKTMDIPCGPILSMKELAEEPSLRATGTIVEVDHPARGKDLTVGNPNKLQDAPAAVTR